MAKLKSNDTIALTNGDIVKVTAIDGETAICKSLYNNMQGIEYKVKTDSLAIVAITE